MGEASDGLAVTRAPRRLSRVVGAAVSMLGGSAMVFGMMVIMNESGAPPPINKEEARTRFAVAPKPPPPPKPKPRPKPRPRKTTAQTSAAPPPSMGASAGVATMAIPGFASAQVVGDQAALVGKAKPSVMTEAAVDARPVAQRRVSAQYPPRARAKGVEGYVTFNMLINERGEVERLKLLDARPAGVFDAAARETLKQWTFQPATYKGEAVKVWARQTIRFKLS